MRQRAAAELMDIQFGIGGADLAAIDRLVVAALEHERAAGDRERRRSAGGGGAGVAAQEDGAVLLPAAFPLVSTVSESTERAPSVAPLDQSSTPPVKTAVGTDRWSNSASRKRCQRW